jgi:hypothetical protein
MCSRILEKPEDELNVAMSAWAAATFAEERHG